MTFEIRPVWIGTSAALTSGAPGPFDVFFSKTSSSDYGTSDPHWVFWHGFPIHWEPLTQAQALTLMAEYAAL